MKRNNELERVQFDLYEYIQQVQSLTKSYETTEKNLTELLSTSILQSKIDYLKVAHEAETRMKEIEDLKKDHSDSAEILIEKYKNLNLRGILPSYREINPVNLHDILKKFYGSLGIDLGNLVQNDIGNQLEILRDSLQEKENEVKELKDKIEGINLESRHYKADTENPEAQFQHKYNTLIQSVASYTNPQELLEYYKLKCNQHEAKQLELERKCQYQIQKMTKYNAKAQSKLQETISHLQLENKQLRTALPASSPFLSQIKPQLSSRVSLSPRLFNTLVGHDGTVLSVCVSPDGKYIISGSADFTVRIWSLSNNLQEAVLAGHSGAVRSVFINSECRFIASGSSDNKVIIWSFWARSQEASFTGHTASVTSVCISPDSRFIISGGLDSLIIVWNFLNKAKEAVLEGHMSGVTSVCMSPNGMYILSGSLDGSIRIWSFISKCVEAVLTGHTESVNTLCVSPDGFYIVSGSHDRSVRVWNFIDKSQESVLTGHKKEVNSVSMSHDGKYIISGSEDKNIKIWNISTMSLEAVLPKNLSAVTTVCMSPEGRFVVSGTMHPRSKRNKIRNCSINVWSLYEV
jgi:WD40 repeat protein